MKSRGGKMKKRINSVFITIGTSLLLACMPFCAHSADVEMNGNASVTGTLSAGSFSGSGAGITNIPGAAISNTSITVNQLANSAATVDKLADAAACRKRQPYKSSRSHERLSRLVRHPLRNEYLHPENNAGSL